MCTQLEAVYALWLSWHRLSSRCLWAWRESGMSEKGSRDEEKFSRNAHCLAIKGSGRERVGSEWRVIKVGRRNYRELSTPLRPIGRYIDAAWIVRVKIIVFWCMKRVGSETRRRKLTSFNAVFRCLFTELARMNTKAILQTRKDQKREIVNKNLNFAQMKRTEETHAAT